MDVNTEFDAFWNALKSNDALIKDVKAKGIALEESDFEIDLRNALGLSLRPACCAARHFFTIWFLSFRAQQTGERKQQ
jgi:hypothetical protein